MYTKDARITIPGFWSCPSVELQTEHKASEDGSVSCSRGNESKCLLRRIQQLKQAVASGQRQLIRPCISFHMKTGRVLFSEKLSFRGRLEDGHSIGNQKYYSRLAKRTTLSEGFRTTWILQIKSCVFIYFVQVQVLWDVRKPRFKRHLQLNQRFPNYAPWKTGVPRDVKGCSVKIRKTKTIIDFHKIWIQHILSQFKIMFM